MGALPAPPISEVTALLRLQVKEEVTTQMARARGELDRLQKQTVNLGGTFRSLFRDLAGPLVGASLTAGIGQFVRSSLEAASGLEALDRRANAVYGGAFPRIQQELAKIGNETRRSTSDLLGFSTTFAGVGQGFGFAADAANDMSVELTRLTADFASYFNIADEQAFDLLRGGVSGATKGLIEYGIVIKETTLQEYASAKGIKTKVKDMNDAQLAALRYGYILEEANKKVRGAAKDTETLANKTKTLKAEWQDLQEEFGKAGTPAAVKAIGAVTAAIEAARVSIGGFIKDFQAMAALIGHHGGKLGVGLNPSADDPNLPPLWKNRLQQIENYKRGQEGLGTLDLNAPGLSFRAEAIPEHLRAVETGAKDASTEVKDLVDSLDGLGGGGGGGGGKGADKEADALERVKELLSDIEDIERDIVEHHGKQADANRKVKEGLRENLKLKKEIGVITRDELRDLAVLDRRLGDGRERVDELRSAWEGKVQEVRRARDEVEKLNDEIARGAEDFADRMADIDRQGERRKVEKVADLLKEQKELNDRLARGEGLSLDQQDRLAEIDAVLREAAGHGDVLQQAGSLNKLSDLQRIDEDVEQRKREAAIDFNKRQDKAVNDLVEANIRLAAAEGEVKALKDDLVTAIGKYEATMAGTYAITEEATRKHVASQVAELDRERAAVDALAASYAKVRTFLQDEQKGAAVKERATGGLTSGMTLVGERGPELLDLPTGTYVHSNRDTRGMLSGSVTIQFGDVHVHNEADEDRLARKIAREVQLIKQGSSPAR